MYDLGFLTPRITAKFCLNSDVNHSSKESLHPRDDHNGFLRPSHEGHDIHADLLPGNLPGGYTTAAHNSTESVVKDGSVPISNPCDIGNSECVNQDSLVVDCPTSVVSKGVTPLVISNFLNEPNEFDDSNNITSGFYQNEQGGQTDFGYGFDALIHGGQLGFGLQPWFRVTPRALPLTAWNKAQDFYELEEWENATIAVDTRSPQCCVLPSGSSSKRNESLSDNEVHAKQPSHSPGELLDQSGGTFPHHQSGCKKELLLRESGWYYTQEADFFLTQLLGENEFSGVQVGRVNTAHKTVAADLEALLNGEIPATREISSLFCSNQPIKSRSTNQREAAASLGRGTVAMGCARSQEETSFLSSSRGKSLELEYPVYDENSLHQTLVWPDTATTVRTTKSLEKTLESGSRVLGELRTPREGDLPVKHIMKSMEYPSIESLQDSTTFSMEDLCPLFPQVSCAITGMEHLTASRCNSPSIETETQLFPCLEKVVAKTPSKDDDDVRSQEQRIVQARRQASGKSWSRAPRMVVIHNRYAPNFRKLPESPSSSEIRKLEEQREENEARRVRVQAFLDRRPALKAVQKGRRVGKTPGKESAKPVEDVITVSTYLPSSHSASLHHQRLKIGGKDPASQIVAPLLSESPNVATKQVEGSVPPLSKSARAENRVRSLVINYRKENNSENQQVTIKLCGKTTLKIRQIHGQPRFFEVDEYLECVDNNNLYSVTLLDLRRKFLSGRNVALFLAGSKSAPLVSWRAVREVMKGVFRDMGKNCELFMSVALVRQGLTQDLLSGSGRLMRTTFNLSPLLNTTLDNVGYTRLLDLGHLSKLIAHGWELARFHQVHDLGFIVTSIILKQVTENDIILSSMLVTCGVSSVHHLNGVLKKDDREPHQLFSGPLGGPCFTVSVLTVCQDDDGIVQLMNTQHKLSSIVNKPGTVGSVAQFLERAEKELSQCEDGDQHSLGRRNALLEQIACAKRAMLDPRNYTPRETIEEIQKRHGTGCRKELVAGGKRSFSQVSISGSRLAAKGSGCMLQEKQRMQNQSPGVLQQKDISDNALSSVERKGHVEVRSPLRLLQTYNENSFLVAPPLEGAVASIVSTPKCLTMASTVPYKKREPHKLPPIRNCTMAKEGDVVDATPPTDVDPLNSIDLAPVVRRKGRRSLAIVSPNSEKEEKKLMPHDPISTIGTQSQGRLREIKEASVLSGCTPSVRINPSKKVESSMSAKTGMRTKPPVEVTAYSFIEVPPVSNSEIVCHLSDSAPVGATASTRYIGHAEAHLQRPTFHVLEMESRMEVDVTKKKSANGPFKAVNRNSSAQVCASTELPPCNCSSNNNNNKSNTTGVGRDDLSLTTLAQEECQEKKVEGNNRKVTTTVVKGENGSGDLGKGSSSLRKVQNVEKRGKLMAPPPPRMSPASSHSKVRKLVVVDPRCNETANLTHDDNMVIVMTEDDFEEYEVDEVVERPDGCESMQSNLLNELRDTFLMGCNTAVLAADSRSSAVSSLVLKSIVRDVLAEMDVKAAHSKPRHKGTLSVSIVQLKGEMVLDLLKEKSTPQKLVIALSPIFGPCVHDVSRLAVDGVVVFDSMLTTALTRATENERDYGVVFVSLVLKQKLDVDGGVDVLVSSFIASLVGENVGLYAAVLDRSPLVPRALFHYALGGPCYTVALLSFSGDETRANQMLAVQKGLGEVVNRSTHRGSINKFISGIRSDLAPNLREKLLDTEKSESMGKILQRLDEMVRDAEMLLKNFEENEPQAYLNETEPRRTMDRKPPPVILTNSSEEERVRSLVCFEQRLLGNGSVAVQGNSVLTRVGKFACRYDVDELVVREPGSNVLPSQLIDNLVMKFLSGHNTALLAADSRSSAITPLILRKIVYLIVYNMTMDLHLTTLWGELLVSIALIRDDVTVDLLAVDGNLTFHRFEVEMSPPFNRRLRGASCHAVSSAERFDQLLAVAVERAEPALRSEDPGVMVVSLSLTQHVEKPKRDVLLSSFMATTVFDRVSHYAGVLQKSPNEPTELFKVALDGPCYTISMLGLCDEDEDAGQLLSVQMELAHVRNRPSHPMSLVQHVCELKKGVVALKGHLEAAESEEQMEAIRIKISHAESFVHEAEILLDHPKRERAFVPFGSLA